MFSITAFAQNKGGETDDLKVLTTNKSKVDDISSEVLSNRAFEVILEGLYPENEKILDSVREKERLFEKSLYDNKMPDSLTEIIPVSTAPGSKPIIVKVAPHLTTLINVIDSTGEPWPISAADPGNATDYNVEALDSHSYKNIIKVVPSRKYGTTNIGLTLTDLPTSFSIILKNDINEYHPSPIIQIDREGPQAKPLFSTSIGSLTSDNILKNIVLGIAPDEFIELITNHSKVSAWKDNDHLYIKTNLTPVSPLPRSIQHGPAGYAAYKLSYIPVIIMTDTNGNEVKIIVEEDSNE